jgi:Mrp family chromosome partitioning ATPase
MSERCDQNCTGCSENCSDRKEEFDFSAPANEFSQVKKVIGVISGKGGVGKSLVTSLMAVQMMKKGYSTAILDADLTGPSIPKAFGVKDHAMGSEGGLIPVYTPKGIALMSINLLLENESDPVVWRGPLIAGTVKQFWSEVIWGDIDFMFIDMPPGTGDVALTVFQSIPIDGIIVVTSPQELVSMIVKKAVKMANMMNIPVLGLVENMSYFNCPDCGAQHRIFGESRIDEIAASYGLSVLGRIPIDSKISKACDDGKIEECDCDWLAAAEQLIQKLLSGQETGETV